MGEFGGRTALIVEGAGEVGCAAAFLASPDGAFLRGAAVAGNLVPLGRPDAVASVQAHRQRGASA